MEIREVVEQIDIVDYISQYLDLERHSEDEYVASCPFHDERTPSFTVSRSKGFYHCFGCGAHGDVADFERRYSRVSMYEAVKRMKAFAGITEDVMLPPAHLSPVKVLKKYIPKNDHTFHSEKSENHHIFLNEDVMEQYEWRPEKFQSWLDEGIPLDQMKRFGYRYDVLSNRIVHPIRMPDGRIFSICGRTLDPDFKEKKLRKYTYLVKLGVLDTLFGLYENREAIQKKGEVILFEGAKSVLKAAGYGYDNCCAVLTSHLNPYQLRILLSLRVRVVIAFDEEVDPRKDEEIKKLKHFCQVDWVRNRDRLLGEKMAPVDNGADVWNTLYSKREQIT